MSESILLVQCKNAIEYFAEHGVLTDERKTNFELFYSEATRVFSLRSSFEKLDKETREKISDAYCTDSYDYEVSPGVAFDNGSALQEEYYEADSYRNKIWTLTGKVERRLGELGPKFLEDFEETLKDAYHYVQFTELTTLECLKKAELVSLAVRKHALQLLRHPD